MSRISDVAQRDGVADRERDVAEADEANQRTYPHAQREAGKYEQDPERGGGARIEFAGRDGAVALTRVQAVLRRVAHVVDRVDAGREQAERHAREPNAHRDIIVSERAGGTGGGDHQRVLDPLFWAHGHQRRVQRDAVRGCAAGVYRRSGCEWLAAHSFAAATRLLGQLASESP